MTAELVGTFQVESPEWHAARAHGLGGSEIAAVLGLSPWDSYFSLWHRKKGLIGEQVESRPMGAGTRLEPVICGWFAEQHPEYEVSLTGTWRAAERPWQIANPDRRIRYGSSLDPCALLEAKFALRSWEWGEAGTDQIPPHYLAQCRWYLDVFDLDRCYVAVFFGSSGEFREYIVEQNPADVIRMRAAALSFLDSLLYNQRPNLDDHTATYEVIRELHPDIDLADTELPRDLAEAFIRARHGYVQASNVWQYERTRVADRMGTSHRATWGTLIVATRETKNGGLPYLKVGPKLPDPSIFLNPVEDIPA